ASPLHSPSIRGEQSQGFSLPTSTDSSSLKDSCEPTLAPSQYSILIQSPITPTLCPSTRGERSREPTAKFHVTASCERLTVPSRRSTQRAPHLLSPLPSTSWGQSRDLTLTQTGVMDSCGRLTVRSPRSTSRPL